MSCKLERIHFIHMVMLYFHTTNVSGTWKCNVEKRNTLMHLVGNSVGTFCLLHISCLLHLPVINTTGTDLRSDHILLAASYLKVILQPTFSSEHSVHNISNTFLLLRFVHFCMSVMCFSSMLSPKLCVHVRLNYRSGFVKGIVWHFGKYTFLARVRWEDTTLYISVHSMWLYYQLPVSLA